MSLVNKKWSRAASYPTSFGKGTASAVPFGHKQKNRALAPVETSEQARNGKCQL